MAYALEKMSYRAHKYPFKKTKLNGQSNQYIRYIMLQYIKLTDSNIKGCNYS